MLTDRRPGPVESPGPSAKALGAARGGDAGAFRTLFDALAPAAWRTALIVTGETTGAADAVATAAGRAFGTSSAASAQITDPTVAMLRATWLASLDILHRDRRRNDGASNAGAEASEPPVTAETNLDAALVSFAFLTLPEQWRVALWLVEAEGFSTEVAGAILDLVPSAFSQLLDEARTGFVESGPRLEAGGSSRLAEVGDVHSVLRPALGTVPVDLDSAAAERWQAAFVSRTGWRGLVRSGLDRATGQVPAIGKGSSAPPGNGTTPLRTTTAAALGAELGSAALGAELGSAELGGAAGNGTPPGSSKTWPAAPTSLWAGADRSGFPPPRPLSAPLPRVSVAPPERPAVPPVPRPPVPRPPVPRPPVVPASRPAPVAAVSLPRQAPTPPAAPASPPAVPTSRQVPAAPASRAAVPTSRQVPAAPEPRPAPVGAVSLPRPAPVGAVSLPRPAVAPTAGTSPAGPGDAEPYVAPATVSTVAELAATLPEQAGPAEHGTRDGTDAGYTDAGYFDADYTDADYTDADGARIAYLPLTHIEAPLAVRRSIIGASVGILCAGVLAAVVIGGGLLGTRHTASAAAHATAPPPSSAAATVPPSVSQSATAAAAAKAAAAKAAAAKAAAAKAAAAKAAAAKAAAYTYVPPVYTAPASQSSPPTYATRTSSTTTATGGSTSKSTQTTTSKARSTTTTAPATTTTVPSRTTTYPSTCIGLSLGPLCL